MLARLELDGDETVLDAGCGSRPGDRAAARAAAARAGDRRRRLAVDDRAGARGARRRRAGRAARRRPARARARASRSTRSSPTRPSTGSSTTSASSRACSRRCGPAARSRRSAAARATSPSGSAAIEAVEGDERFAAYLRGMPAPGTSLGRRHRATASSAPASRSSAVWLEEQAGRRRASRASSSRTVGLAAAPRAAADELHEEFVDAVLGSLPRPLEPRLRAPQHLRARRPA